MRTRSQKGKEGALADQLAKISLAATVPPTDQAAEAAAHKKANRDYALSPAVEETTQDAHPAGLDPGQCEEVEAVDKALEGGADERSGIEETSAAPVKQLPDSPASDESGAGDTSTATAKSASDTMHSAQTLLSLQQQGYHICEGHVVLYINGSSVNNGNPGAMAGTGVFYGGSGLARLSNKSLRLPGIEFKHQTNMQAELYGPIAALEDDPVPNHPLEARAVSNYMVNVVRWLELWRLNGYRRPKGSTPKNSMMIEHLAMLVNAREQPV